MYRPNTSHQQRDIFGVETYLPKKKLDKLKASKEYTFYQLIFCNINEDLFSVLYSDKKSRPNAPINAMVSALVLMQQKGWTYEQLFNSIDFDLTTRAALGLQSLVDTPFVPSTLFDFQNRVNDYRITEGINLFEALFDTLTQQQLKELRIKTDIQRSDSFLAAGNIRRYSRIQLLVEVLIRLHRILSVDDKDNFNAHLQPYVKKTSGQYIFRLQRDDIPHELEQLAQVYHALYPALKANYQDVEIFRIFERVFEEHFAVLKDQIAVKASEDLHSGMLQSPDDIDATYRQKRAVKSRGQAINITETTNPENELNLLTDITVEPNNMDDSAILNKRIDGIKEKTPDINELHTDGGYGSADNDEKLGRQGINHIQTGVRGRKAGVRLEIEMLDSGGYAVRCRHQRVLSEATRRRHKACFAAEVCKRCELKKTCPTLLQIRTPGRVYYFTHSDYLADKRQWSLEHIPEERWKLRPNVEATVKEFRSGMNHKNKLKVRGKFKTEVFAFTKAVSINFGRIFRYIGEHPDKSFDFAPILLRIWRVCKPWIRRYRFCSSMDIDCMNPGLNWLKCARI